MEDSFSMDRRWEWGDGFRVTCIRNTQPSCLACTAHSRVSTPMKIYCTAALTGGGAWDVMRAMGGGCKYRHFAHLLLCSLVPNRPKASKVRRCHIQSRCRVLLRKKENWWASGNTGPSFPRQTSCTATTPEADACFPTSLAPAAPHRLIPASCRHSHYLPHITSLVERPCGQIPAIAHQLNNGGPVELVTKDEAYFQSYKFFLSLLFFFFFNKTSFTYNMWANDK